MDMLYNADVLPFEVEFFSNTHSHNVQTVKEYWGKNQVAPKRIQELIQVKENIPFGVRMYAKDGLSVDINATIVLQSASYDEEGKMIEIIVPITNTDNKSFLFKHQGGESFPWRLGVYLFDVHYGDQVYSSAFFVSPIHLSTEQVQHMHLLLEQEIEGICYDLIYTSKSIGNEYDFLKAKSYYDYVLRLMNDKEKIVSALYHIERKLKTQVKTAYVQQPYQRKNDQKSIRWTAIHGNSLELNKIKVLDYNLPENKWLKHILISWKTEMIRVGNLIKEDCKYYLEYIRFKEDEKKVNEAKKNLIWNEREVSKESRDSIKSIAFRIEEEIKKADCELSVLARWDIFIQDMIGRFSYVLASTDLNEVDRGLRKPYLKDRNYCLINDAYEDCRKVMHGEAKPNHVVQILKPTWKIYEQFAFFQVVNIIKNLGFKLKTQQEMNALLDLHSGFLLEFENEYFLIHIWYNKLIYLREDAKIVGDLFFSTRLIQPDIRIDLYQKGDKVLFLSSIALDAKHRKYNSLYNDNFTTNVFTQLSKYNSIYYQGLTTSLNRRRSVVSSVICLYSRDKDAPVLQEELPLVFIQLFPEIDEDMITGKQELEKELSDWISQNEPSFI
ncbi:hypothetical protein [Paenibacillus chitinolyticus]|uniref:hypothetical protein n=1 Tax=Paenibacillus chitinolyticus TaxID=79263 RepID=UPI003D0294F8